MRWITKEDIRAYVAQERETTTRETHIEQLDELIAENRDDVFAYSTAAALAYDFGERRQRLDELVACATAGKRTRHLKGLFATSTSVQDPATNQKIAASMKEKFPIFYAFTKYTPIFSSMYLREDS